MNCGIIDLGSNTIRLSIYRVENGSVSLLLSKKSIAGLLGYIDSGVLSPKGFKKTRSVLKNFRLILDSFGIESCSAFATESLRRISNRAEVIESLRRDTGFDIELLTGEEEALLDYAAVTQDPEIRSGLLADIGGGSTELVVFRDRAVASACSMPIGSLNLSLPHITRDVLPDEKSFKKIQKAVLGELKRNFDFPPDKQDTLYGVGGSVRAAKKIYNDFFDQTNGGGMDRCKLRSILDGYRKNRTECIKRVVRLTPDRIHTVMAGMIELITIAEAFGCRQIVSCPRGVREGYLFQRVLGGDPS